MRSQELKDVVWISFLAAIMLILEFMPGISFPFFPGFLSMRFTVLPAIIATFALGPIKAVITVALGLAASSLILGSGTMFIGELANLLIWSSVVVVIGFSNQKLNIENENKRAFVSLLFGVVTWMFSAVVANLFILVPLFIRFLLDGNTGAFVAMLGVVPGVTYYNFMFRYIMFVTIPFAILQTSIIFPVTFMVHKRVRLLYLNV